MMDNKEIILNFFDLILHSLEQHPHLTTKSSPDSDRILLTANLAEVKISGHTPVIIEFDEGHLFLWETGPHKKSLLIPVSHPNLAEIIYKHLKQLKNNQ